MAKYFIILILVINSKTSLANDFDDYNKAVKLNNSEISRFCSGIPKEFYKIREALAESLRVNPSDIHLKRVELFKAPSLINSADNILSCKGIYYHSKGILKCNLHFDEAGLVKNACGLPYDFSGENKIYTQMLSMKVFKEYFKIRSVHDSLRPSTDEQLRLKKMEEIRKQNLKRMAGIGDN